MFTYFAGVDKNGHLYGGDSPQYADAIRNVNDNLGDIMDAVEDRGSAALARVRNGPMIVVTDHGHVGPHDYRAAVTASNHPMRHRHSSSPTARISRAGTSTTRTESLISPPRL